LTAKLGALMKRLITPVGLVDVTSRYQLRAAGLSMVVMPERRMSACDELLDLRAVGGTTQGLGVVVFTIALPAAGCWRWISRTLALEDQHG
jgi:hypothetical protein